MTPPASKPSLSARDRLIIALDVRNAAEAQTLVRSIGVSASIYKVGKQLFTSEGPSLVRDLVGSGRKVFLDLKYHDIPNTVASAVRSAVELKVAMLTVHASGGSKMVRAAAEAAAESASKPLVLAVTVLTSMTDEDLHEIGIAASAQEQVLKLAKLAQKAGIGGLVASPSELKALRQTIGQEMKIVTPGVRPAGSDKGDQARVATPADAIANGADYIVVGRPITAAADPAAAAQAILAEISGSQR
jgi:orotidine-5'-phosphate decarboxylase